MLREKWLEFGLEKLDLEWLLHICTAVRVRLRYVCGHQWSEGSGSGLEPAPPSAPATSFYSAVLVLFFN